MTKAFVLDTSVLIHDPQAIASFRDTTVAVPIFVVMELDDLKVSPRVHVSAAARSASRYIDKLSQIGQLHAPDGVIDPRSGSRVRIVANGMGSGLSSLEEAVGIRKMDHLILGAALSLQSEGTYNEVKLVSKDVNLRILAGVEGLTVEDYDTDRVEITDLYRGYRHVEDVDSNELQRVYIPDETVTPSMLGVDDMVPNEFLICEDGDRDQLLRYHAAEQCLKPVPRDWGRALGIAPRNTEQRLALDLLMDPEVRLVTLVGKAGTGKTFLALAAAMAQLDPMRTGSGYERILLSKPVIPLGKDIGFLPGDFEEKMAPWMMSFFDNLDQLVGTDKDSMTSKGASNGERGWEQLFESRVLEVQAIHSIRGRSISNAFMLIDEAQNLTPHELKTIITRAAEGTKVILAGDPFQVDNHFLDQHTNGLTYVTERMKGADVTGTCFFTRGERSALAELAATLL